MSKLVAGSHYVRMDEPCYWYEEINKPAPDSKGVHRYRTIKVYRHNDFVEFVEDMGLAGVFATDEFQIPGGAREWRHGKWWYYIEETVGSLMDIAEQLHRPERQRAKPKPSDLIGYYHTIGDRRRKAHKRQSTFGPLVRTQRS